MDKVFGGASVFVVLAILLLPVSTSAATQTVVGQQITITAAVQPSRFVIIDTTGAIQQIISNNSVKDLEPEVYLEKVAPENKVEATSAIRDKAAKLLLGRTIKPGILYDRKTAPLAVEKLEFIELLLNSQKVSQTNNPD